MAVETDVLLPIFQLVAILLSAKLAGAAASRIGQPPVLGELLAGILIGPSLFNLVERTELFAFLAELGAIVLLFEVGLESDLGELRVAGPPGAVVAATGIVLPFLGGWAFAFLFLADGTVALFVGASLTATSIGITARVFSDLGRLATREAQIVLAAAIFDDVVGLILLSVLVSLAGEGVVSVPSIALTVVLALVFVLGSIAIGARSWRRLVPLVHRLRGRGVLLVFAFALALTLSGVAAAIGLATIIGAFAAGLVLAETEERARIEKDVKPIADILVPIFFVIMGTLVDVRTFLDPAVLGVAAVLTAIALATKVVTGYGLRDRRLNRLAIGVGMVPRGEVGIIFAGFGLTLGVITPALYSALLVMVVVTTFAAPPLLKRLMVRPPEAAGPVTEGGGSRSPP